MRIRNRKALYLHSTIIRGRRFRDGEEDGGGTGGGADSGATGNNTTGNQGDSTTGDQNANNDGQSFDATSFWNRPSDGTGDTTTQDDVTDEDFGKSIMTDITGFSAPTPLFDDKIAKEISEGNFDGLNQRFNTTLQTAVRQAVVLTAKIMQRFESSVDGRIAGKIGQSQTQQGDEALLKENFNAFAQPAMQPVIRGIFQQSLIHTKGDRTKAVEMTKGMMKQMGSLGRSDFGIEEAPRGPDDFMGDGPSNLVQSLLSAD